MSIFNTILEKLGIRKDQPASAPAAPAAKPVRPPGAVAPRPGVSKDDVAARRDFAKPVQAAPRAISEVDVVKKLEQLGAGSGLDWKVSIVDLLKLLGIDSGLEARKELAVELGCPADLMKDSAKMNTWLHKTVLKKIAENGGNIPQSLLS